MMGSLSNPACLLRIYTGEDDRIAHTPLYETIVEEARRQGLAGATVIKGILSYGTHARLHTAKLIDIAEKLPIVIELIDTEAAIRAFVPTVRQLLDDCGSGGLVTISPTEVVYQSPES